MIALRMIKMVFLGTSAMVPTKDRNASGIYLEHHGNNMLIDCGEGIQRQMNIAGINRNKIQKIFITHWHADHIAGILGLIQTMGNKDKDVHLDVYGPKGSELHFGHLLKASVFDQQLDITVHEVADTHEPQKIFENSDFEMWAISLCHSTPTIGYRFVEKDRRRMRLKELEKLGIAPGPIYARLQRGNDVRHDGKLIKSDDVTYVVHGKKIAFIADTRFCKQAVELARGSDVLVTEATYIKSEEEKAHTFKHLTSEQAAQIASMAEVGKLYLTHFSQRYATLHAHLKEAQDVFPDAELANDFKKVKI